jgi:hypothetical protein
MAIRIFIILITTNTSFLFQTYNYFCLLTELKEFGYRKSLKSYDS